MHTVVGFLSLDVTLVTSKTTLPACLFFSTAFGLMQTFSLFTSAIALDICVNIRILGTVAALGGMSTGAPNPNLAPLIVLDLGKSPAGSVMLGLPSDKDEH